MPPYAVLAGPAAFAAGAAFAYYSPQLLRTRARALRKGLAVLAALFAALLTDVAPTEIAPVDVAYRAAAMFGFVTIASRARRIPLSIAAGIGIVATHPRPLAFIAACVALGLAVATGLATRRSPVAFALAGALLGVGLLDASWPSFQGGSAALTAIAVVIVVASGLDRSPSSTRRAVRRAALATAAAATVASAAALFLAMQAKQPFEDAIDAAHRAIDVARRGDVESLEAELATADEEFDAAAGWVGSPLAMPARLVPVVSQHVAALDGAASAGKSLADRSRRSIAIAELDRLEVTGGGIDLPRLEELAEAMGGAELAVAEAADTLDDARSPWLLAPLQDAIERESERVTALKSEVRTAARVLEVLPGFLGADGQRRYFLAVQTPVESRASGGLLGNFGEIVASDGRLHLDRFGRSVELNTGGDPSARTLQGPADYVSRYSKFEPETTWQNVTMSPDFPAVAEVIANLYPQSGGRPVDGVVSVDPTGLAALLRLTGQIRLPSWPQPLNFRTAERVLYYDQYIRFDKTEEDEREDFLGDVAREVTRRLTVADLGNVRKVLDVLEPAVRGGHLKVSTTRPDERALLDDVGLSGRVAPVRSDYLQVVTQNAAGNKIDWFLRRDVTYEPVVARDGTVRSRVELTLRNTAPASGLPKPLIGNAFEPPIPDGINRLYLSVYTPLSLLESTLDDAPLVMESEAELGRRVHSAFVDIPPGGEVVVALELVGEVDLPYRLDVGHQPTVNPDQLTVAAVTAEGDRLFSRKATVDEPLRLGG